MTTDKLFILLLVILLPLTGCIDTTENAEAQVEPDNTSVEEQAAEPEIYTLHIDQSDNTTLTFDGTETLYVETIFGRNTQGAEATYTRTQAYTFSMTCNGTLMIETGYISADDFLPILPNQVCNINIDASNEYFITFSKHTLGSL